MCRRYTPQCPDESGLGLAVANRLKKAAGFHVVDVSPLIIGFTGPTGAGKTSALRALERLGGLVLDCDAVYHQLLRTDAPLRAAITAAFGPVFTPDGMLDRQKLGAAVFSDPAALNRLNAIIFDRLPRELLRRVNESDATMVGIDAINLVESGLYRLCRRTVAVLAPTETPGPPDHGPRRYFGGLCPPAGAGPEARRVLPRPLYGCADERRRLAAGV